MMHSLRSAWFLAIASVWVGGLALSGSLLGCAQNDGGANPAPTLREAQVPPGFAWETTKTVALQVEASADSIGQARDARVEVRHPETGAVVFRGQLGGGRAEIKLGVGIDVNALDVEIKGRGRAKSARVAIAADGSAQQKF